MSRLSIRECRIEMYSKIKANIVGLDPEGSLMLAVYDGNMYCYRINAVKDHVMIFDVLSGNKVIDAQYTKYFNMGCNVPTSTICEAVTDLLRNTHHLKNELFFTIVHGSEEELYIDEFRNRFKNRER